MVHSGECLDHVCGLKLTTVICRLYVFLWPYYSVDSLVIHQNQLDIYAFKYKTKTPNSTGP